MQSHNFAKYFLALEIKIEKGKLKLLQQRNLHLNTDFNTLRVWRDKRKNSWSSF